MKYSTSLMAVDQIDLRCWWMFSPGVYRWLSTWHAERTQGVLERRIESARLAAIRMNEQHRQEYEIKLDA